MYTLFLFSMDTYVVHAFSDSSLASLASSLRHSALLPVFVSPSRTGAEAHLTGSVHVFLKWLQLRCVLCLTCHSSS